MKVKTTKVSPPADGTVVITHNQSVRQSRNYNSAECSYGVQLTVPDNDADIRKGISRAVRLVETLLNDKVAEQTKRLEGIVE